MPDDVDAQLLVLLASTVDRITEDDLRRKLESGRTLRVKLGIDPTASDIHLGFTVVLRKLRQFQELGHTAVLILGDFTARVGDPSGRSATRPQLLKEDVDEHARTYVDQAQQILLPDRLEVRRNSEWLERMGIEDVVRLTSRTTVARILDRNDFAMRYREGDPISVTELLYPLLQGWDSVMVEADVELGGTDQLFNVLMGRQLQEQEGQEPQVVLTTPLLPGLDGVQKMSKSLGNYVGVTEAPGEQFGKLMSIPDGVMAQYFELTTGWSPEQVEQVTAELATAEAGELATLKRLLARTIVSLYHGHGAGEQAEVEFDRVFKQRARPSEIAEFEVPADAVRDGQIQVATLLRLSGITKSGNEARTKIAEGAVYVDEERVTDPKAELSAGALEGRELRLGRKHWVRLRFGGDG